jgi:DNA-3-methyladenine glycosylase II
MFIETFSAEDLSVFVDKLIIQNPHFQVIIEKHGTPPFWHREPNFETLIRVILEQQVSLASAKAAYDKLIQKINNITPQKVLALTDEELKSCYFSRQKIKYARALSEEIESKRLDIELLNQKSEPEIRAKLTKVKGIGNWTVDVYLLLCLHHIDIFPIGDLAAVNALRMLGLTTKASQKEEILALMETAKPYRSVATYLLWHYYIEEKGLKV